MIFKRAVAKLRAQDWTAVTIELAIVVLGVFLGMWVANRNQDRQAADQVRQTLIQLTPELQQLEEFSASARRYYARTGKYAGVAFAGWSGDPAVDDDAFIIAAYQASQIYGFNNNGASWALVFGAGELRNIADPAIRQSLTRLMTFDYSTINIGAVQTRYRDKVREIIPDGMQQQIRDACGDKLDPGQRTVSLSATCPLKFDPKLAAEVAAALHRHRELAGLLRQHRSVVSAYLTNLDLFDAQERILAQRIALLER